MLWEKKKKSWAMQGLQGIPIFPWHKSLIFYGTQMSSGQTGRSGSTSLYLPAGISKCLQKVGRTMK